MVLILTKINEKGSYRWIGENYQGLFPQKTVIAGTSIKNICNSIGFVPFRFRKYHTKNVFIAFGEPNIFYVYVNPFFRNYRFIFDMIVGGITPGYHVDHILSKNLAKHFKYNYVLLCMIPDKVNIRHGRYEKQKFVLNDSFVVPDICYSDDRIYDKILKRSPTSRRSKESIEPYFTTAKPTYGLTLKQKGIWNTAFGFDKIESEKLFSNLNAIDI